MIRRGWNKTEQTLKAPSASVDTRRNQEVSWGRLYALMDRKASLVSQESRRLVALEQNLTVEEAMLLASALGEIVRRHVQNPDTLRLITRDMSTLFNVGSSRRTAS